MKLINRSNAPDVEFQSTRGARLLTLLTMLTYRRPMGSDTERSFVRDYIEDLPGAWTDAALNVHVVVDKPNGKPSQVLWSCHTDTVHFDDGRQSVAIDKATIHLDRSAYKWSKRQDKKTEKWYRYQPALPNCLGADCTVGVWIMREMILARVPGHYVFHFGEECGGKGSSEITQTEPELFDGLFYAIAFDRRGTTDVITHQAGGRCCSRMFAKSLARQLKGVARYSPSDRGIYTDTAEYTYIIGECTNLSVGYYHEHSEREFVNYHHSLDLLDAMLRFDESTLAYDKAPDERIVYVDDKATGELSEEEARALLNLEIPWNRHHSENALLATATDYTTPVINRSYEDMSLEELERDARESRRDWLATLYQDWSAGRWPSGSRRAKRRRALSNGTAKPRLVKANNRKGKG